MVALHAMAEPGWTAPAYHAMAREGFMRNPVCHRCVRMIAQAAAAVPWLAYDGPTETPDHGALALLARPNDHQTATPFLETVFSHLLLAGNAYVERLDGIDSIAGLHVLRPDRVRMLTDEAGWPDGFAYELNGATRTVMFAQGAPTPPLLHLSQFHPLDDQVGFAPVQSALMALDIHNAAARWNKALLDNAARPSGALVYAPGDDTPLTPEQFDRLKRELEEGYTGAMNAGRPLLLEGGLDWKAMGLSPRDMDFMEARNGAARDIALAFGVPPMLLGIPGDNTYANYAEANRAFYRLTVLPLVRMAADGFAAWLGPHFGGGLRLAPDLDQIEGLTAEREALWTRLSAADWLTDAEKREAAGYSPQRPPTGGEGAYDHA